MAAPDPIPDRLKTSTRPALWITFLISGSARRAGRSDGDVQVSWWASPLNIASRRQHNEFSDMCVNPCQGSIRRRQRIQFGIKYPHHRNITISAVYHPMGLKPGRGLRESEPAPPSPLRALQSHCVSDGTFGRLCTQQISSLLRVGMILALGRSMSLVWTMLAVPVDLRRCTVLADHALLPGALQQLVPTWVSMWAISRYTDFIGACSF